MINDNTDVNEAHTQFLYPNVGLSVGTVLCKISASSLSASKPNYSLFFFFNLPKYEMLFYIKSIHPCFANEMYANTSVSDYLT